MLPCHIVEEIYVRFRYVVVELQGDLVALWLDLKAARGNMAEKPCATPYS